MHVVVACMAAPDNSLASAGTYSVYTMDLVRRPVAAAAADLSRTVPSWHFALAFDYVPPDWAESVDSAVVAAAADPSCAVDGQPVAAVVVDVVVAAVVVAAEVVDVVDHLAWAYQHHSYLHLDAYDHKCFLAWFASV